MLITCPECKSEISDQAQSCPKCGYILKNPQEKHEQITNLAAVGVVAGLAVLGFLAYVITATIHWIPALVVLFGGAVAILMLTTKPK